MISNDAGNNRPTNHGKLQTGELPQLAAKPRFGQADLTKTTSTRDAQFEAATFEGLQHLGPMVCAGSPCLCPSGARRRG